MTISADELWAILNSPTSYAANAYGSGPGYLNEDSNPYARIGNRYDMVADVNRLTGLFNDDVLGLQPNPVMPEAPGILTNDSAAVWQSNPIINEAMQAILAGQVDPITAVRQLQLDAQDNPSILASLPTTQGQFGAETPDWANVQEMLTEAATTEAGLNRQRVEYDSAMTEYENFYNDRSLAEINNLPDSVDEYVRAVMGSSPNVGRYTSMSPEGNAVHNSASPERMLSGRMYRGARNIGSALVERGNSEREAMRQGGVLGWPALNPQGNQSPAEPERVNSFGPSLRGLAQIPQRIAAAAPPRPMAFSYETNPFVRGLRENAARQEWTEQQNTVMPSQNELNNRQRMAYAYEQLFGEVAPNEASMNRRSLDDSRSRARAGRLQAIQRNRR